jgi:beta-mannosidase
VWTTDEGLNGVIAHAANDGPEPLDVRLRVAFYRNFETRVEEADEELELPAGGSLERSVEAMLGWFVDAAYAYRFAPPAQYLIVVSLESAAEPRRLLSQSMRFPAGRPAGRESPPQLGIETSAELHDGGSVTLTIRSERLAYGVRVQTPRFTPEDDAFSVEPGGERVIGLRPTEPGAEFGGGSLTALNMNAPVKIKPLTS